MTEAEIERFADIGKMYSEIKAEAINNAVEYMILAFIQFLGDKRGWKQKITL